MARAFFVIICISLALGACTQRTTCPAFQSAFIYDKDVLRKKFSYFQEDSTPKILTASKNKYLIAEPVSYTKKVRSLQTVEMKDIYPILPDSMGIDNEVSLAELDMAARSVIDSTYIIDVPQALDSIQSDEDSVYVITKDKEVRLLKFNPDSVTYHVEERRYNVDQDNYMWYLRDVLLLPDVRLATIHSKEAAKEAAKKEKKKKGGFFRNLFKKKQKEVAADSTEQLDDQRSEFDLEYTDEEADTLSMRTPGEEVDQPPSRKRKSKKEKTPKVKAPKKKKEKKEVQPAEPAIKEEERVEEEDDGGF